MTIVLSLLLPRPDHLRGLNNNLLLLSELGEILDGLATPLAIELNPFYHNNVRVKLEFEQRDDPFSEPMTDEEDAFNFVMDRLKQDGAWLYHAHEVHVVSFEPDEPSCSEKETRAQKNLGVRPFSE